MGREYIPKVPEVETELIPLLPGLGAALEEQVEYPEVVLRRAVRDGFGQWKIDESLVISVFNTGIPLQTCFVKVEKHQGDQAYIDYYQIEYYKLPDRIQKHVAGSKSDDETWIITEVNNVQMADWLTANGILPHSEEVIHQMSESGQRTPLT